jgi:hypothetical protein
MAAVFQEVYGRHSRESGNDVRGGFSLVACGSGFVAALVTRLTMSAILRGHAAQTIAMFVRFGVETNENCRI